MREPVCLPESRWMVQICWEEVSFVYLMQLLWPPVALSWAVVSAQSNQLLIQTQSLQNLSPLKIPIQQRTPLQDLLCHSSSSFGLPSSVRDVVLHHHGYLAHGSLSLAGLAWPLGGYVILHNLGLPFAWAHISHHHNIRIRRLSYRHLLGYQYLKNAPSATFQCEIVYSGASKNI